MHNTFLYVSSDFLSTKQNHEKINNEKPNTEATKWDTLLIAGGEDDRARLVSNEALSDTSLAKMLRDGPALRQDGVGGEDLHGESMSASAGLQLIDLLEFGLPQGWLGIALLR